jgi:hypothetical protein
MKWTFLMAQPGDRRRSAKIVMTAGEERATLGNRTLHADLRR